MRWFLAIGLLIGLLLPVSALPCDQHPVPERDTGLVRVEPLETTGLFGFWYDTNADGVADFALIFQQGTNGHYITWPVFYFYRVNPEGFAEEVWQDVAGRGLCSDIRLYYKRTVKR